MSKRPIGRPGPKPERSPYASAKLMRKELRDPWFDKPYEPTPSVLRQEDEKTKMLIAQRQPKKKLAVLLGGTPKS